MAKGHIANSLRDEMAAVLDTVGCEDDYVNQEEILDAIFDTLAFGNTLQDMPHSEFIYTSIVRRLHVDKKHDLRIDGKVKDEKA